MTICYKSKYGLSETYKTNNNNVHAEFKWLFKRGLVLIRMAAGWTVRLFLGRTQSQLAEDLPAKEGLKMNDSRRLG